MYKLFANNATRQINKKNYVSMKFFESTKRDLNSILFENIVHTDMPWGILYEVTRK